MRQNIMFTQKAVHACFVLIFYGLVSGNILQCEQTEKPRDCGCQILEKYYNALYIRFERTSISNETGKPERLIWLRLRNNTSCPVHLDMIGLYYRLVDGKAVNDALDGEDIHLHFAIESESGREYNYRTDQLGIVTLLPGRSVNFDVSSRHFKKKKLIAVPFQYAWASTGVDPNPRCEVLFRTDRLPQGWEKMTSSPTSQPEIKK